MNKINWSVRFTLKNKAFLTRLALAIGLPVLTYFGLNFQDMTSWGLYLHCLASSHLTLILLG